jgi:4-methyl-5(b-hydroxyethyl)-thiazole monophosphate biosynthesis
MTLLPDTTLDSVDADDFDMVVLPGGLPGADYLDADPRIHAILKRLHQQGKYTAAICAAPKVLAGSGLLNGRQATAYPGVLDGMSLPQVQVMTDAVISDGRVITSRGPGTAMDFALALIEKLQGSQIRDEVGQGLSR